VWGLCQSSGQRGRNQVAEQGDDAEHQRIVEQIDDSNQGPEDNFDVVLEDPR
jgi:hypothetical protein